MASGSGASSKPQEQEYEMTEDGSKRYNVCGMRFEVTPNFAVKKAVGQGAYGLVCSGSNTDTGKKVAIKKIPKAFEDTVDCKRLLREIKILRHFKHDNVLGLLDILPPTGDKKDWKDVYIVSELMDTDLHYIIHSKQPLTDEHFKYFLYQILRGVHAIHSAHVLHRDLKPGNLLVNKNCDLKICDFGLARPVLRPFAPPLSRPRTGATGQPRPSHARHAHATHATHTPRTPRTRTRRAPPCVTLRRPASPCVALHHPASLCITLQVNPDVEAKDMGLTEYVVTRW